MENVKTKDGYNQVCVMQGVTLGDTTPGEFEEFFKEHFGARAQYLETIQTNPDRDGNGADVPDTGGRSDIFFAVHQDDVTPPFCIARLKAGIRWVEDVLSDVNNENGIVYPERVLRYKTW